jgi:hypothetical protein
MRALLDVTNGGVFWIVALGPARWAMRILPTTGVFLALLSNLPLFRRDLELWVKCSAARPAADKTALCARTYAISAAPHSELSMGSSHAIDESLLRFLTI